MNETKIRIGWLVCIWSWGFQSLVGLSELLQVGTACYIVGGLIGVALVAVWYYALYRCTYQKGGTKFATFNQILSYIGLSYVSVVSIVMLVKGVEVGDGSAQLLQVCALMAKTFPITLLFIYCNRHMIRLNKKAKLDSPQESATA